MAGKTNIFVSFFVPAIFFVVALVGGGCANQDKSITLAPDDNLIIKPKKLEKKQQDYVNQKQSGNMLSIEMVIARAIKYNLAARIEKLYSYKARQRAAKQSRVGSALRNPAPSSVFDQKKFPPKIDITGSYLPANVIAEELYQSYDTGSQKSHLATVWNLLDSGINHFYLQQLPNEDQVFDELRRKMIENLMQEARTGYWKVVAAQQSLPELELILEMANESMKKARAIEKKGRRFPTEILQYQLTMLDVIRRLEQLKSEFQFAQSEFAILIKHNPDLPLKLLDSSQEQMVDSTLPLSLPQMEQLAILLRPELQTEQAVNSVNIVETRESLEKAMNDFNLALPGSGGESQALNSKKWEKAGVNMAGKLFNLERKKTGQATPMPIDISMAIIAQVNIAYSEYIEARKAIKKRREYPEKIEPYKSFVSNQGIQWAFDHLAYVDTASKSLFNKVERYEDYGRFHNSVGRLQSSIGFDLLPFRKIQNRSVKTLAKNIELRNFRWHSEVQTLAVLTALNLPAVEEQQAAYEANARQEVERRWKKEAGSPLTSIPPEELLDSPAITKAAGVKIANISPKVIAKTVAKPYKAKTKQVVAAKKIEKPKSTKEVVEKQNDFAKLDWRYAVQVAAVYEKGLIVELLEQLHKKGYSTFVWESKDKSGKKMQRVWIGLYKSFVKAKKVQEFYSKQESKPAFIVSKHQIEGGMLAPPSSVIDFKKAKNSVHEKKPTKFVQAANAAEEARVKAEKAKAAKLAKERAEKAKVEKLAREKAKAAKLAKERAEKAKAEKLARERAEKAKAEKLAREKAKAEKLTMVRRVGKPNLKPLPQSNLTYKQINSSRVDLSELMPWHYAVQVSAVYEDQVAEKMVNHLSRVGYSPFFWEAEDENGRRFRRILLGVFKDVEQAVKVRRHYSEHEHESSVVVPVSILMGEENMSSDIEKAMEQGVVPTQIIDVEKVDLPSPSAPNSKSWRYAVQVAALYDELAVDELVSHLAERGYKVVVWPSIDKKGIKLKKILIGLFQSIDRAKEVSKNYQKIEHRPSFIIPKRLLKSVVAE
ncbi:MAG: SPOR domain-containing protein [Magnetococcales bacterium]|nr:SPOR domain-containing protein [Magnetococcales bacterium]